MRIAAAVSCVLLLASGCSGSEGPDCTLIGAGSGITVQLHRVLTPHRGEQFTVKTCLDSNCSTQTVHGRAKGRAFDLVLGGDLLTDGKPRTVTVTIEDSSGRTVFDGRSEVSPRLFEPNGPECEPHVWVADLRAVGTERLNVLEPPE